MYAIRVGVDPDALPRQRPPSLSAQPGTLSKACPAPSPKARPAALRPRPQASERKRGHVTRSPCAGLFLSPAPTPKALASNLNGCILED